MFRELQNEGINYLERQATERKKRIIEAEKLNSDIKCYLSDLRIKQFLNNKITLKDAKIIAVKKVEKQLKKDIVEWIEHLEQIAASKDLESGIISASWKRSYTWGYNPSVEMRSNTGSTHGHASGCGYDKLSAAVAEALNANKSVLKALYKVENKRLREAPETSRRDYIGYGSGHYYKPYFEGGVGCSCYYKIFEKMGYKFKWDQFNNSDVMTIIKA